MPNVPNGDARRARVRRCCRGRRRRRARARPGSRSGVDEAVVSVHSPVWGRRTRSREDVRVGGGRRSCRSSAVVDDVHVVDVVAERDVEAGDAHPAHGAVALDRVSSRSTFTTTSPSALASRGRAGQVGQEQRRVVVQRPHLLGIGQGDGLLGVVADRRVDQSRAPHPRGCRRRRARARCRSREPAANGRFRPRRCRGSPRRCCRPR